MSCFLVFRFVLVRCSSCFCEVQFCLVQHGAVLSCVSQRCAVCSCSTFYVITNLFSFNVVIHFRKFLETRFEGETGLVYFNEDHSRNGSNYNVFQLIRVSNATGWLRVGKWESGSFDTRLMVWILTMRSAIRPPLLRISTKRSKPWVFFTANQDIDPKNSQCVVGIKCINYTSYISETNNSFVQHCCSGNTLLITMKLFLFLFWLSRCSFTMSVFRI